MSEQVHKSCIQDFKRKGTKEILCAACGKTAKTFAGSHIDICIPCAERLGICELCGHELKPIDRFSFTEDGHLLHEQI